jgi:hypothetical protein
MSEPRKDVKVMLDPEVHAALKVICAHKDVGLGEFIESLVAPHVRAYVHDVMLMADDFRRSGISRDGQESPGKPREGQE